MRHIAPSRLTVGALLTSSWLCPAAPLFAAAQAPAGEATSGGLGQGSLIDSSQMFDTALGLVAVLALMLVLAWLVKRFVTIPGMKRGQVQVVGGVSLGPRERAVLVQVEGERLLLGVAPGRVQMLHQLRDAPAADEFSAQLADAEKQSAAQAGAQP